ncbi:MAG: propanol-preferring alcohol dehydrogenase, partial [Colwellia sp.]
MKAAVIHQFKDKLEIKQLDKPTISSHEVLVKVHACGVCHTDLHACHGDWPVKPKMPLVPGHE